MGIQNQSCLARTRFPALANGRTYLLRILIGSFCCLHLLRLAKIITFVLVLRHLIGNRSKSYPLTEMSSYALGVRLFTACTSTGSSQQRNSSSEGMRCNVVRLQSVLLIKRFLAELAAERLVRCVRSLVRV